MKMVKFWAILALLLWVLAIPVSGYANSGGPKNWFHFKRGGSAPSHYRGNHIIVKHHAAKHSTSRHASNSHR